MSSRRRKVSRVHSGRGFAPASSHPFRLTTLSGFVLFLLALPGCKGCRSDKPYTPFGVTSALPSTEPSVAPLPSASAAPEVAFPIKKSLPAEKLATHVQLGERGFDSPEGRVFEQLLAVDLDGDGQDELLAYTAPKADVPPNSDAPPGELYLYRHQDPPAKILDFPTFLPSGPTCTTQSTLTQDSPRTVEVDLRVRCKTQLVARAPTRAVVLLEPLAPRPFVFGVRTTDPAPEETLVVDLLARDADNDGRNDPGLRFGVGGGTVEPPITIQFDWFDRAAGASRDARQPSRALVAELDGDLIRAQRKKSVQRSLTRVEAARRTLFSACDESGTPRLFDWEGAPLRCELSPDVLDRLAAVEVTARLTEGEAPAAISALMRDGWYLGAMRPEKRVALIAAIEKKLPPIPVTTLRLDVSPKAAPRPRYSPLRFLADGSLQVVTEQGGVATLAASADRAQSDVPALPWPLDVSNGTERLTGPVYSCDRSEVQLLVTGSGARMLPLRMLAPRPGACRGGKLDEAFPMIPVAADEHGFEVIWGGVLLRSGDQRPRPKPGSPRSDDGNAIAFATPLGLAVVGGKGELWKVVGWDVSPGGDCVLANDVKRAACIRAGRVEVYSR
jgi:hypothetical protein